MTPYLVLIASLLTASNAQIECNVAAAGNSTVITAGADASLVINSALCLDDDMMYIDIEYFDYRYIWFGIVFSEDMEGYGLVYTTGQENETYRQSALYQYNCNNTDYTCTYNPTEDWTQVSETMSNANYLRIVYKKELSLLPYDITTTSIPVTYAYGKDSLVLGDHGKNYNKNYVNLTFTTVPQPTASPTTANPTFTFTPTSIPTASPISVCPSDAIEASVNVANKLQIRGTLCASDEMMYIHITYSMFNENYFGIVFDSNDMYGFSLIYTTGKVGESARNEGLYAYNMTDVQSKDNSRLLGVMYSPDDDWTEVLTQKTNGGIHVIYKQAISNTPWDISLQAIKIGYAIGDSLTLSKHTERNDRNAVWLLNYPENTQLTQEPVTTTKGKGCDRQDLVESTAILDAFTVTIFIKCDDNTVDVTISNSVYNANWFGIVFNNEMIGNALIYTQGKSNETPRKVGLYPYSNTDYDMNKVTYDGSESDWTKISEKTENSVFTVHYRQDLSKTDAFSRETEEIHFKWAQGDSLILSPHASSDSGRASSYRKMNLLTGNSADVTKDFTLETAHGVLMWLAWAVFAPVGIMSSAFRHLYGHLYPKGHGQLWFFVHQGVQTCVVCLTVIAFIIAIAFTERKNRIHFSNAHMIIGLIVSILCVMQPINALFRGQPPKKDEVKPVKRIIWEYVHKCSGYIAWILGCITATLGLQLVGEVALSYVHIFLWCGLLLIIYVVLFVVKIKNSNTESNVKSDNKESNGAVKLASRRESEENPMLDTHDFKVNDA